MIECAFVKTRDGYLAPIDDAAKKLLNSVGPGNAFVVKAKKARNIKFMRKFFALLNLAFEAWEPDDSKQWKGNPVAKDFERFRKDVLILAGHYEAVYKIDGSVILIAKSIAFDKCEEFEFNDIYKSVLDVVWNRILKNSNYSSQDEVEAVLSRLLSFT